MTRITLHDTQEPFTPNRDRAGGFYRNREDTPVDAPLFLPEPEFQSDPATDYEAIIAALKAQLSAKPAFEPHAEPEPVEMPDFLKAPEAPPAELADLFEVADTPAESNEKLLVRLREVLGLIGLAEDAGGRAAPELYRRKDRLESGIRWNRGRSAEVI
jgi:hypothetical protein